MSSDSPLDVENLRARVSVRVGAFVSAQRKVLPELSGDLGPAYDIVDDFLKSGKRLRPAFCWWAWRGCGGDDADTAIAAASALELIQACALIHDDVMDGSDTRRGLPAVHKRFAALHGGQWRGSQDGFGTAGAILLGDLCLAWADELFFSSGMEPEALLRAKPVFDIMRTELMAGQYLDVLEQARGNGTTEDALTVIRYKSAKYTIERPLHLGAALAGAPPGVMTALTAYGLPLGEAFQLRDDVLGVFGDPEITGKPAGDDLREGKRTFLTATARAAADSRQTEILESGLGKSDLSPTEVDAIREVLIATGALAAAEAHIADRTAQALAALDTADITSDSRKVLADLAAAATNRAV